MREEVGGAFGTAALAGLVAAVIGGIVWALIVRWSDYEVGFVAWGIGFIVGTAVAIGARGERGVPYQVVAVVLALAGILIGKYLSFVWTLTDAFEEEGYTGIDVPIFSTGTWDAFMDARSEVWSLFDALWVGLAAFTAFRIPGAPGELPPPEPAEPAEPRA